MCLIYFKDPLNRDSSLVSDLLGNDAYRRLMIVSSGWRSMDRPSIGNGLHQVKRAIEREVKGEWRVTGNF